MKKNYTEAIEKVGKLFEFLLEGILDLGLYSIPTCSMSQFDFLNIDQMYCFGYKNIKKDSSQAELTKWRGGYSLPFLNFPFALFCSANAVSDTSNG